jgi:hypothetical protein
MLNSTQRFQIGHLMTFLALFGHYINANSSSLPRLHNSFIKSLQHPDIIYMNRVWGSVKLTILGAVGKIGNVSLLLMAEVQGFLPFYLELVWRRA